MCGQAGVAVATGRHDEERKTEEKTTVGVENGADVAVGVLTPASGETVQRSVVVGL